jgi:hypothetical protein
MLSKSIVGNSSSKSSSRNSGKIDVSSLYSIDNDDRIVGHCSISLEQLCKVALANAASSSATVAAPRIMVHRGRPMHNLDGKTLQVGILSLSSLLLLSLLFLCRGRSSHFTASWSCYSEEEAIEPISSHYHQ